MANFETTEVPYNLIWLVFSTNARSMEWKSSFHLVNGKYKTSSWNHQYGVSKFRVPQNPLVNIG